jgi:V8-like Glu-specific endopeptidase
VVQTYKATAILEESLSTDLDFAIIELDRLVEGITDSDLGEVTDRLPLRDQKQRVFVIGHPSGGSLSFSMQDNLLLDYEDPRLHYRAPTEGGSSGSPVYNGQWKLIGLHHAGDETMRRLNGAEGTYAANEGIWIASIRRALSQ